MFWKRDHHPITYLILLNTIALPVALYKIAIAPKEQTMGIIQKIFYLHMPLAVLSLLLLLGGAIFSVAYLIKRKNIFDRFATLSIEVGMLWATFVLISGSIWAKKAWHAWWVWEPRLTFVLIMWLTFGVYLILRRSGTGDQTKKISAIFALLGAINIPLIHISVHRLKLSKNQKGGMILDPQMKEALLYSFIAMILITTLLLFLGNQVSKKMAHTTLLQEKIAEEES